MASSRSKSSKPRRSARMSTGGKPPRSSVLSRLDVEADEAVNGDASASDNDAKSYFERDPSPDASERAPSPPSESTPHHGTGKKSVVVESEVPKPSRIVGPTAVSAPQLLTMKLTADEIETLMKFRKEYGKYSKSNVVPSSPASVVDSSSDTVSTLSPDAVTLTDSESSHPFKEAPKSSTQLPPSSFLNSFPGGRNTGKRKQGSDTGASMSAVMDVQPTVNRIADRASGAVKKQKLDDDEAEYLLCASLPPTCEVYDLHVQDEQLHDIYKKLCNLRAVTVITLEPGEGNVLLSQWPEFCPEMNPRVVWSAINFERLGRFINPSRISPLRLQGIPSYYYGHSSHHALGIDGQLAICVGLFMSVRSSLHSPSTLGGAGKYAKKYISAIPHSQEYERMFSVFGMVFHESEFDAGIHKDAILFHTKTTDKPTASVNKRKAAPSKASVQREGPARGSTSLGEVFPVGTKIPVYDGRFHPELRMETDIERLDAILPPYDDEIPDNSCVFIGYTVAKYQSVDKSKKVSLACYVRFVVLLGDPTAD